MYFLVGKTGKYWRYNYQFSGKFKTYAIGLYPVTAELKAYETKREKEGFKFFVNCLKQSIRNQDLFLYELKLLKT